MNFHTLRRFSWAPFKSTISISHVGQTPYRWQFPMSRDQVLTDSCTLNLKTYKVTAVYPCRQKFSLPCIGLFSFSLYVVALMLTDENDLPSTNSRRLPENALQLGPRKKPYAIYWCHTLLQAQIFGSCLTDPSISHGCHFGRTVYALCNVKALITNGLLRLGRLVDEPEETFTLE